ncbi:trypsin-like peptidase domain-containing protein [Candidatus Dependentiae bacterium]|nr:trypsin-like peptidase domain-containing protein [Candidatus Dependentiae bacterium]
MAKKNKSIIVVHEQEDWLHIEDLVNRAVVHIFAQVVRFNWLEPYKPDIEYEQRGTGFFINAQGDIVTTAHVVDQAKRIWIQVPSLGWQTFHVEVAGFCPDRDIALLRIAEHEREKIQAQLGEYPFLQLGDSDQVRRTDRILVMGYPLGQHHLKMTTGIVSGREFVDGATFLQITAPMNPGDSGGPVLNVYGHVVGIAIASVQEATSIGYAIPASELALFLHEGQRTLLVRKCLFGVRFNIANDDVAHYLSNPVPAGAYINLVLKDSLAEQVGLLPGDMLYACNDYPIDAYVEVTVPWSVENITFYDLISRFKRGDEVKLTWYRRGEKMERKFSFEPMPPYPIRLKYPDYEVIEYEIIAGMILMELADNHFPLLLEDAPHLEYYQRVENKHASVVVVNHILPGSVASQLRSIFPGDILSDVNGQPISTLDSLRAALRQHGGSKYLTMTTRNTNAFAVFDYVRILHDEQQLAHDYGYVLSPVIQDLCRMFIHDKKEAA